MSRKKTRTPYLFNIIKRNQFLFFFGAEHSFDPDHFQFKLLKKYWENFLERTDKKNSLVLVEGGSWSINLNEKIAIKKNGESGFITFLASKEGIEINSPEPSEFFERSKLLKNFSKDEIQYYYFARIVYQWNKLLESKPNFKEYMDHFLKSDKKDSGWEGFDFSIENMKKIHKILFNKEFDENDKVFFYRIINPNYKTSVVNKVSKKSSEIRDLHILKAIKHYWEMGKNIFIVYGSGHALVMESDLKNSLK